MAKEPVHSTFQYLQRLQHCWTTCCGAWPPLLWSFVFISQNFPWCSLCLLSLPAFAVHTVQILAPSSVCKDISEALLSLLFFRLPKLRSFNLMFSICFQHNVFQPVKHSSNFPLHSLDFVDDFGSGEVDSYTPAQKLLEFFGVGLLVFFFTNFLSVLSLLLLWAAKLDGSHEIFPWQFLCNILSLGLW